MRFRLVIFMCLVCALVACAQVPKQSVELSATVGRDLVTVHNSHRELAQILFSRMERDINHFVDTVYAPYQIRELMKHQQDLATSHDPNDQRKSLLLAINAAFKPDASAQLQDNVLKGMGFMVQAIHDNVEAKRKELIDPIKEQENQVLASIDRSYQQLQYANSTVTGYLASIVQVNDAQNQILKAIGVDRDLNTEVGQSLAKASESIGSLVDKAGTAENAMDKAEENGKKIKEAIGELKDKLKKAPKEI